ncbi:MAG TPA: zeta toxin family protein [Terracidiphilus sp.]
MKILNRRPIIVALAGPNGAGKTSFYRAFLQPSGLRFVNADLLALQLQLDVYQAAHSADELRRELAQQRESFIFETVFSDPVGDKLEFLKNAESLGYTVVLFFIGIDNPESSGERVAIRVSRGGHDVPSDKIAQRYPRILKNLKRALVELSNVRVYDNSIFAQPHHLVARREDGGKLEIYPPTPAWLRPLLP